MNIYKEAAQGGLRFNGGNGVWAVEDLYRLRMEVLDGIAKDLNKDIKGYGEESFIASNSAPKETLLAFEVVKDVIATRLEQQESTKNAGVKAEKKQQILKAMDDLANKERSEMTKEELQAALEEL